MASRDLSLRQAAIAIHNADVLLFASGAGWSADSGLAVYADVADVPAYRQRFLTYGDLCKPQWLCSEAALFFGFWGKCFNDYRDTPPHEGYTIVRSWRDRLLAKGSQSASLAKFMALTSNVDEHLLAAGFDPVEVREVHGNAEVWQCAGPCTSRTWRAPKGYRFNIDPETMLAPPGLPKAKATGPAVAPAQAPGATLNEAQQAVAFGTNHPKCPFCAGPGRPAILMFDDGAWQDTQQQAAMWEAWRTAVITSTKEEGLRFTIVEVGCGLRVRTIRMMTEAFVRDAGPKATLVRINPEVTTGDTGSHIISIPLRGLEAVRAIEDLWGTVPLNEEPQLQNEQPVGAHPAPLVSAEKQESQTKPPRSRTGWQDQAASSQACCLVS
eukprot:TRINITY_DN8207_c0_g1_i1.p1 TRINITY_DN8207_c0_g1~~TRINITY_DN8207_c0_g1_i1.p1  ORF type:complete len:382 (-),score=40.28 TRINITY_DN8207_c0_g1_i1:57-1202(-)